jgi:Cytochrome oxidase complex assembly protein 1
MATKGGGAPPNPSCGFLRDLIRPPFRRFSIDTELSAAEIIERLRAIVEPGNAFLASFRRTSKLFAGDVSSDGFKVVRLIYYSNGFQPVVIGRFDPGPHGTCVQVTMRLKQYASAFVALWLGMLALIVFVALFVVVFSSRRNGVGNWLEFVGFACAIGGVAYLMVAISFGAEARMARRLLEEALQPTPGPRIQNVLSSAPPRLPRIAKHLLLGAGVVVAGFGIASVVTSRFIAKSEPFRIAENYVRSDPFIQDELGIIKGVDLKRFGNQVRYAGSEGSAKFAFKVEGTRRDGVIQVAMKRHFGVWQVSAADLHESSGRIITLRADTESPMTIH